MDQGENVEEELSEEVDELKPLSLKVLVLIREQQQKHGLRHADYQRYRGYCSRRLRRIRKAVGMVQGEKKKFHKKEVTEDGLKDEKHLHIPLVTAERAWAYYMQLKFESNSDPRKKFHKKEVTEDGLKDEKHLHIPLVTAERAWAYYMQLKFESN